MRFQVAIIFFVIVSNQTTAIRRPYKPNPVTSRPQSNGTTSTTTRPEDLCSYPTEKLVCVDDYEEVANRILNINAKIYYASAADEEITYRENILAYKRLIMRPRTFVDVSDRDISTTILGKRVSLPIGVSPVGSQKLQCPEGEISNARGAAAAGSIYIHSTFANTKIEDVAQGSPNGRKWMQVYFFKRRAATLNLVRRAEASGFEAIVATVDSPVFGFKRSQHRLPFKDATIRCEKQLTSQSTKMVVGHFNRLDIENSCKESIIRLANFGVEMGDLLGVIGRETMDDDLINNFDDSITGKDIIWLKSVTRLPIFLKGILNADDAEIGVRHGANGIFVSNHGGRQLDTDAATIDLLSGIVKRLKPYNATVIVDGGVRKGTDIFKALAFGAHMVFAGRPFVWGLSVAGEKGVENIFNIFRREFNDTMALAGVTTVRKITRNYVGRSISPQPRVLPDILKWV